MRLCCGIRRCSQDAFYENYFESQRDHIFRSVELLIYVFDIESREIDVRVRRGVL